ncbi:hypothetical protein [Serratia fonticola]
MLSQFINISTIVSAILISLVPYLFRTPWRLRNENHRKLLTLLEAMEQKKSETLQILLFRDFMRNKKSTLSELKLLSALEDIPDALERYRLTGGKRSILNIESNEFHLKTLGNNKLKRFLLSLWTLLKYFFFVVCLCFTPLLMQLALRDFGAKISLSGIYLDQNGFFSNLENLFLPALFFLSLMGFFLYMTIKQLSQAGNVSAEARFYRYYVCKREEQTIRELITRLRHLADKLSRPTTRPA